MKVIINSVDSVSDLLEPIIKLDPIVAQGLTPLKNNLEEACNVYPDAETAEIKTQAPTTTVGTTGPGATSKPSEGGPHGASNIHAGSCFMLLFSFMLVKQFV